MCGFVGVLKDDRSTIDKRVLRRMTRRLRHRGPDGEGIWTGKGVGLGHRRLAILDLTRAAAQPMIDPKSGMVLVYNGELYNFRELRAELEQRGERFVSRSDTEVVLKMLRVFGLGVVKRFNGMFAFACWDPREDRLLIGRDRYGVVPLYYCRLPGCWVFGSEIKSFLDWPDFSVDVSLSGLQQYFTFQNILTDETLFKGVKIVPPGHVMQLERRGRIRQRQYWDFCFENGRVSDSIEDYVMQLRELFDRAVQRQLVSDVEVGSYLSGGIDSGSITCVAARELGELKTFTAGFDLSTAEGMELFFDERERAEYLSRRFKTEHYEVLIKAGDMERVMRDLVWHLEDLRIGQCYPNMYVARLASRFLKVVLAGTGGDELFAGYPWRYYRSAQSKDFDSYVENYFTYWQRLVPDKFRKKFFREEIRSALDPDFPRRVFRGVLERHSGNPSGKLHPEDYVNSSLYFEAKTFLHGLLIVENRLSMAYGLETRVPFLDNDLVDFAMKVPVRLKLRNITRGIRLDENLEGKKEKLYFEQTGDGKLVLRRALERFVPRDYAQARKQGFSAPDASWFRKESSEYIRKTLSDPAARIYDYLDIATVSRLLEEHFSGKVNHRLLIWSLLSFEWWLKLFRG